MLARTHSTASLPSAAQGRLTGRLSPHEIFMDRRLRVYGHQFFSSEVKLVTTVTDWLTCWEMRSRRIFFPPGGTS